MNFLIDESQNKLILQVFNDIEKSLDYSVKLGKKTQDELFNQFFGTDTQTKPINVKSCKAKQNNHQHQEESPQEYQRISRSSTLIKQQTTQKPIIPDLLKNSKALSNIHLRHLVNSYLKNQCKKIESLQNNYSCDQVKDLARNLLLNFFLRYTLIFEQLQTMKSSQTIEKQLRKSVSTIYVEIFSVIFKKGFRNYLTILKMLINIWLISSYIPKQSFLNIKREVRHILGINIQFLLKENDKLTYELAFKLRGMPLPGNFSYEKEKQRKKQQKLQRKKQKLKKKVLMQIKQHQINKTALKNIKLQSQIPKNIVQSQQKSNLSKMIEQKVIKKVGDEKFKEILTQKIENKLQKNYNVGLRSQIKSQNFQNKVIDLQDGQESHCQQKNLQWKSNQKFEQKNSLYVHKTTLIEKGLKQELTFKDQKFIETLRKKIKSENSFKKQISSKIKN